MESFTIEQQNKEIKAIFKDMLKYSPSKICGMVGNAIVIPIYTSLLAPHEYGLYIIAIALLSFLCIIFSDWVGLSGLRFFRKYQITDNLPKYLSTIVSILSLNILFMFIVAFIFRNSFYEFFKINQTYFIAILFLIIPVAIRALLFQLLRAQIKPLAFTLSTILNQILTISISIILIKFFNMGAMAMLLGMGISISFIDLILIYQSNILKFFKAPKICTDILLPIFIYGVPISLTSLSTWLINQSNKVIMNSFNGFTEVGYVGVAWGVTFPILMTLFSIFTVAAIPRIIRLYEDKYDVRPIISKFTGYYILASLPVIVLICLFAPEFVQFFANEKFFNAYKVVPYFAVGVFFIGLADYTTLQYHLANKTYIDFIIKLVSGVLGIYLNIFLIPKYGLVGVGIATLSANFLYFILSVLISLPNLKPTLSIKTVLDILLGFCFMLFAYKFISNLNIGIFAHFSILLFVFYIFYFYSKVYLFNKIK